MPCTCTIEDGKEERMSVDLAVARRRAHQSFDAMWKRKAHLNGWSHDKARAKAYAWLANRLGITGDSAHMSKMDSEMCSRVVGVCTHADWVFDPHVPQSESGEGG